MATCQGHKGEDCKALNICFPSASKVCPTIQNPVVCGDSQVKYPNACEAEFQQATACKLVSVVNACKRSGGKSGSKMVRNCRKLKEVSDKILKEEKARTPKLRKMLVKKLE